MYHLFFLSSLFIRLLSIFIWNKPFLPVKPYPGKARSSTGVLLSYDTRVCFAILSLCKCRALCLLHSDRPPRLKHPQVGAATAVLIVLAVLCLTADVRIGRRRSHRIAGRCTLAGSLEALAAGILTYGRISSTHLDISSAAVHGIVIHTALCRTY